MQDTGFGVLYILGAWCCFGSFAVPMKVPSVQAIAVDPLIFQTYKTFWTFVTSWLVLLVCDFSFTWWGLASGLSWVPAGVAAILAVRHVGIALGQMTWQVLIIIVSFAWGMFFGEHVASVVWTAVAATFLLTGLLGMTLAFNLQAAPEPVVRISVKIGTPVGQCGARMSHRLTFPRQSSTTSELGEHGTPRGSAMDVSFSMPPRDSASGIDRMASLLSGDELPGLVRKPWIGVAAAVFNGLWGGSNLVPMHFAPSSGLAFVVSFATGAAIVNGVLLVCYAAILCCRRQEFPPWHFRVMFWPGLCCGVLWSAGNMFSVLAVQALGQAVGYSCVQASVLVSGCWGIFYYQELQDEAAGIWFTSAALALIGVVILSQQRAA